MSDVDDNLIPMGEWREVDADSHEFVVAGKVRAVAARTLQGWSFRNQAWGGQATNLEGAKRMAVMIMPLDAPAPLDMSDLTSEQRQLVCAFARATPERQKTLLSLVEAMADRD